MTLARFSRPQTALITGLICGLLAAAAVAAGARWLRPGVLEGPVAEGGWTGRSRGWLTSRGFHAAEVDQPTQGRYSWTSESARLQLSHLDRTQRYTLTLDISAIRPQGMAWPAVNVLVDGAAAGQFQATGETQPMSVTLPARATDRASVVIQSQPPWVPGPPDTRALGVIVRGLHLVPERGHFTVSSTVLINVGVATALTVAGVLLCGIGGVMSVVSAAGITAAYAWLSLQDAAFIGTYTDTLLNTGIGIGLFGLLLAGARRQWPVIAGLPDWATAVGLVLGATVIKLAVFNHPLATVGDGIFQLHRAQLVHSGSYFFTSITPRPFFEFPYAIGLYVTAMPFWSYFSSDLDQVRLLRGLALGADALVGVACYAAAYRQWNNRLAALLVAALWPFARAPLEALCNSNLTNVFGQGVFGVSMGALAWMAASGVSIPALLVATAFLTAGYLSHFSTFSVGVPLVGVIAVALVVGGRARTRTAGFWILASMVAAVAIAYVVYYSHFLDVYRATWARIVSHETVEATGSAIAATPAVKFQRWATGTSDDYGLPGVVLAAASLLGAVLLARQRPREGVTLVLAGWLAIWVGFTALGILSAVQMRVNLAAAPLFTCLAAYALAAIAARSASGRVVALAAAVAIAVSGARLWLMCLGM